MGKSQALEVVLSKIYRDINLPATTPQSSNMMKNCKMLYSNDTFF